MYGTQCHLLRILQGPLSVLQEKGRPGRSDGLPDMWSAVLPGAVRPNLLLDVLPKFGLCKDKIRTKEREETE